MIAVRRTSKLLAKSKNRGMPQIYSSSVMKIVARTMSSGTLHCRLSMRCCISIVYNNRFYQRMEMDQQKPTTSPTHQLQKQTSVVDIRQLRQIVMKQHKRNLDLSQQLKQDDVYIDFALCQPQKLLTKTNKPNSLEGERKQLMILMDRLMLESDRLEKLARKNKFNSQRKPLAEDARSTVDTAYGFMRRVWTQALYDGDETSDDKMDRLSKVIGSIKGNLQRVLGIHRRKDWSAKQLEDILLDIPSFARMKEAYERLQMNRQEMNYTFQFRLSQVMEKLKAKEKQNDQLRQQIKQQRDRIRKLQNQSILAEGKVQQLTDRLNKLAFQHDRNEKRIKLVYNANDFELSIKSSKLGNSQKLTLPCDKQLQQLRQFLDNKLPQPQNSPQYFTTQAAVANQYHGSPMSKLHSGKKSTSIRKMQSPCYRQQISNVKFARTNSLIHNGAPARKPSEQANIEAKFYTKLDIIEKLEGAFTK